jgi:hypothetical protein
VGDLHDQITQGVQTAMLLTKLQTIKVEWLLAQQFSTFLPIEKAQLEKMHFWCPLTLATPFNLC